MLKSRKCEPITSTQSDAKDDEEKNGVAFAESTLSKLRKCSLYERPQDVSREWATIHAVFCIGTQYYVLFLSAGSRKRIMRAREEAKTPEQCEPYPLRLTKRTCHRTQEQVGEMRSCGSKDSWH